MKGLNEDFNKIIIVVDDLDGILASSKLSNNLILPTKYANYSRVQFDLNTIIENIKKFPNIQFYLLINRIFFDSEIDELRGFIEQLLTYKVKFIFSDLAVYMILKENEKEFAGIYSPNTLITNYLADSFWLDFHIDGLIPSQEIPLKDIVIMGKNRNIKLYYKAFGYSPMYQSRRKILSNYKQYKGLNYNPTALDYYLKEETRGELYKVVENDKQSTIFQAGIYSNLEGIKTYFDNVDYIILDGRYLDQNEMNLTFDIFKEAISGNLSIDECMKKLNEVFNNNISEDFMYEDSVYKKEDF